LGAYLTPYVMIFLGAPLKIRLSIAAKCTADLPLSFYGRDAGHMTMSNLWVKGSHFSLVHATKHTSTSP